MELFKLKNVSFAYTNEYVLQNINLTIDKGDFVGIVGKNGAGKSTLLKLMIGQLKPSTGQILRSEQAKIGYVEQVTMNLDNTFPATVMEIVLLGLYQKIGKFAFAKNNHKKLALAALKTVGMQGFENRQISALSGGQQQKVLIAKTLVQNPDILILDEPTTGIDKQSEKEFFELLEHLNQKHQKTILIVTHSIEKVLSTTRQIKIENKTIVEEKNV
jgi:zinc transport system ATP-binding protein